MHLSWWRPRRLTAWSLVLIALWLTACAPLAPSITATPTVTPRPSATPAMPATPDLSSVPVTSLLQAAPLGDEPTQPVYTLVTNPADWDNLNGKIPEAALQAGREASDPVIVAFAGVKGSSGYQVSVRRAALHADRLIITVEHAAPGADDIVEPATTLPFALATIPSDTLSAARSYVIVDGSGVELSRGQLMAP